MIKAIVMDMDGTLLDPNNKILPETKEALLKLQNQGVTIVLASGRNYSRLMPYAKELELDTHHGHLIETDGIATYDVQNRKREVLRRMAPEEVQGIFPYLMNLECESMACFDNGLFDYFPDSIRKIKEKLRKEMNVPEDFPWTAGPWGWLSDMRFGYPNITYIKDSQEINCDINKIQIMQEEDNLAELYKELIQRFEGKYEIFRTCPTQIEILPFGYSKGKTLKRLMKQFNWNPDEVFVFGDGENDVSMFEVVTHSFAMGQAKDYVKEKAAHVTSSNYEQGIKAALELFHLI